MAQPGRDPEVIEVPDDNPDDFPDSGPQNPAKAQTYHDKIDEIMMTFSDLLVDDRKDALRSTITSLKKLMVKHWSQMSEADIEVIMKSIHDPSCMYLCQHLTTEGVEVTKPSTEIPEGWTFLRQLPEKTRKAKVQEMIISCFDHLSEVHAHMSSFAANMSSLAKICDPETYNMVLKVTARPMIQVNVPECYLSPVQDPPPKDNHRREIGMSQEGFASLGKCGMSSKRTKIWAHQASRCSHLVATQMKILQQWHSQRSMHHIRSSSQAAFEATVGKSLPWWHWWEATKHRISRAQTQEEAKTPYNRGI